LIYCGIDWAERTHDVALVDDTGQLLAKRHITDDAAGYKILLELLAEHGDTEENPNPGGDRDIPRPARCRAATRFRARSPTPATPSSWRTSCAQTCTPTVLCQTAVASAAPSPFWLAPNRTLSAIASRFPTSSAPCCASTTRPPRKPSTPGRTVCAAPGPPTPQDRTDPLSGRDARAEQTPGSGPTRTPLPMTQPDTSAKEPRPASAWPNSSAVSRSPGRLTLLSR
jgi:hypothetical protein